MASSTKKPTVRLKIERELARKVQVLLEKKHERAVSMSETCEHALKIAYTKLTT